MDMGGKWGARPEIILKAGAASVELYDSIFHLPGNPG